MSYKIGGICAVYGCNNYSQQKDSKSFFRMPKDFSRLKTWINACKRKDLDQLLHVKSPEYFYKIYKICSDHFEEQYFRNKKLLSQGLWPTAVPTLNLFKRTNPLKRKSLNIVNDNNFNISPKRTKTEEMRSNSIENEVENVINISPKRTKIEEMKWNSIENEVEKLKKLNEKLEAKIKEYKKKLHNKTSLISKYRVRNKLLKAKLGKIKTKL